MCEARPLGNVHIQRNGEKAIGLPLDGIRVIEMSHMVMGPSCGMFLAFLGAEVIKIESPEGDKTRI